MLASLVKESKQRRADIAAENGENGLEPCCYFHFRALSFLECARVERRKREAVASISAAADAATQSINMGAATVWHNQQQLEAEARLLHQQSQRLVGQTSQWISSYQGFHQALKDLGDVENWAQAIESDMSFISSSLEELQQQQLQEQLQRQHIEQQQQQQQQGMAPNRQHGDAISTEHTPVD